LAAFIADFSQNYIFEGLIGSNLHQPFNKSKI
jgi:hypothetical protein